MPDTPKKSKRSKRFIFLWRKQVYLSDMNSNQKHVAIAISEFGTSTGFRAFPSINLLAEWTSLSEKTVRTAIHGVVKAGFLKVESKAVVTGKGWRRHVYTAMWPDWLKSKTTDNNHQDDKKTDHQEACEPTETGYEKMETSLLQRLFFMNEQESIDPDINPMRIKRCLNRRIEVMAELKSRGVDVCADDE